MISIASKANLFLVVMMLFGACISDTAKINKVSVQEEKIETKTSANQVQVQEP